MSIVDKFLIGLFALLGIFCLYMLFVYVPVALSAEIDCLEMGFPETRTTITLKSYCVNMEGVVRSVVKPL
jgi:hypothetical protein